MEIKNIGKALGALAMLGTVAWASYLWAGTQRLTQLEADVRVLKVEIQGELRRMADEQGRMREEMQHQGRMLDELAARRQR